MDAEIYYMNNEIAKKHYAFISYNHRDIKAAKWLHKKLESYKLPTEIHNEYEDSKYLRPVFRDQEDLDTGVLSDELRKHLESSKYLIVICSPNSAKSDWVSNEVKMFIEWGRLEYIIPFVIDGTPNSGDENECFPKSLLKYVIEFPDRELLGINIAEVGREKAFVRVVSRMLGVSFDELWKRHERERRRRIIAWSVGIPFAACLFYYFAIPVSLSIRVVDENHRLPMPSDAVLVVANAEYPLNNLDTMVTINTIPGYNRWRKISAKFSSTYYIPVVSEFRLGIGIRNTKALRIERDSSFAIYKGTVIDLNNNPIKQAQVQVGDSVVYTDDRGHFKLLFSIEEQSEYKKLQITKSGKQTIIRDDECPSMDLKYIMHNE